MKAVMITYNQVLEREIHELLDARSIRGFTRWVDIQGRGSEAGEPHYGTHTWPALNGAVMAVVDADEVDGLLEALRALDEEYPDRGIRAFAWAVEGGM